MLKHTMHSPNRDQRLDPQVTLTTLLPYDTTSTILARSTRKAAAQRLPDPALSGADLTFATLLAAL